VVFPIIIYARALKYYKSTDYKTLCVIVCALDSLIGHYCSLYQDAATASGYLMLIELLCVKSFNSVK
jgi:hypothetical protein